MRWRVPYNAFGLFVLKDHIVALDLVEPKAFYKRRAANKRRWLGYDTGVRPDYFPIRYAHLDIDASRLLYLVTEAIERQGRPLQDLHPQTIYPLIS